MSENEEQPGGPDEPDQGSGGLRGRLSERLGRRDAAEETPIERLRQELSQRIAEVRSERVVQPVEIRAGTSNFSRAQVPWGMDLAAAWAWRVIVIAALLYGIFELLSYFAVLVLPVIVALLIAALVVPVVDGLSRVMPRGLATLLTVLVGIASVGLLLTFVGQQVAQGVNDLTDQVVAGISQIRDWLRTGPLHASDSQINDYLESAQKAIAERGKDGEVVKQVTEVGTALGHVVAGFFIVLFSTYFFLADGGRIWAWLVRLSPRAARARVDSSGRVAWISLTRFVRATVIVALTDAIGVMIVAGILGVPFVLALGVLVFLGAFIPMIGATIAGTVAVLVALVDQGPITALFMLGGVIVVQQIEGHILQPFLMGRWVSVHPLGVILAIGAGVLTAGIAGALIAVPLAAAVNAVVLHLAEYTEPGDDPAERLDDDLGQDRPDNQELEAEIEQGKPDSAGAQA